MKERSEGAGRRGEPTPLQARRPDRKEAPHQRGEGTRGVPTPQGEQAQPQQERGERKKRRYLVYHPKKETREEYGIRYDLEHARREIEQAERRQTDSGEQREKRQKYKREYMRGYRKRLKEQRQAALGQEVREQRAEAIQIFPSPKET